MPLVIHVRTHMMTLKPDHTQQLLPFHTGYSAAASSPAPTAKEDLRIHPPVLMNEQEVARFIGICPRSVRNFTTRGVLPVIRLGRRRLYRRDTVLAALRALECPAG